MKNQITNLITKIISILVIMLMMVNSSLMLVISVAVDAVQKIIDETKINAVYELNMEKYVNYKMGDKQGTLVQTYLKTGIEYQEGQEYVPIDTSNVIINTPKINDKYPESVEVVTKSTKATNGDGNGKDVNYAYNKENGQLKIITENKADDKGNIYTENVAGARDEYQLDFYYDANCYNDKNEKRSLEFKGNVELKLKDDRDIRKNQEISQNFEVAENVSGLVSADVTTSNIYNGYIQSNIQNNSTYSTGYAERIKIQTSYKEIADEITVNSKNLLVNNKDKENETQEIIYKNTKVNKNEILDKLGQDGYFQIIDKDGNILATINKDTEADENGNIQIGYDGEKTELNFKFSKPLKLGDINILNTKEIKDTMKDANVTKVETRNTVSCVNNVTEKTKVIDEETKEEKEVENTKQVEIYNYVGTSVAEIKEAKTDVKVTANNTNWTNNVQNDVTFTATLVTSGPEYNLFKNPVIDIKLPNEVEKVVLGESSILYDNGLQLGSVQVVDDNGSKVIRVKVNGTQTSYVQNEVVNGTNIVIPASIILKKDIASSQENIAVSFANYRNVKSPETGNLDIPVNVTSIINNNASADEQGSNNGASTNGVATSFAAVSAQATLATANNTVVEAKPIDLDKISVEYKAFLGDKELADGDSVHENEYIKYVAKVRNNTGEDVNGLNVVASVPEGTTYVEAIYGDLKEGTYDRCSIDEYPEKKEITSNIALKKDEEKEISFYAKINSLTNNIETLDIKTSIIVRDGENEKNFNEIKNVVKKAKIDVDISAWITARENNVWLYQVIITNNTSETIKNVNVSLDTAGKFVLTEDEGNKYFTQNGNKIEYTIDSISGKNGKTDEDGTVQNQDVRMILLTAITQDKNMEMVNSYVTASYDGESYYSAPNVQKVNYPDFEITQSSDKEGETLKYGEETEYVFKIKNNSNIVDKINVEFEDFLDKNMKPISIQYENYIPEENSGIYTEEKRTIEEELNERIGESGDIVTQKTLYIPNGKEITIKIKATPEAVMQRTEVTNYARVIYNYNGETPKISNYIKNVILPFDYVEPDPDKPNPDNPDPDNPDPDNPNPDKPEPDKPNPDNPGPDNPNTGKYSVSGLVWKDENKNGIRENSEMILSGITVKLFNIDTNEIVVINNEKKITTTDANGKYTFSGIDNGNYIVLFEYDTNKYKLTTYKGNGATEETNSDVINKSVSIDGVEKNVGVTDTINVSNQNKLHIDMGLIENGTYNISLNKYITNIKVTYGNEEQNYAYDNSKLVKVEIPAKKVNGAKLTIEYNIEVKNEGDKSVSVDSIVDYKPDGLDFSRENNSQWSIDANNVIKYNALSGKMIKPGETENIKIYFTKNLTKDNLGTFTNVAEVVKISNEEENQSVNKKSQVDLIVSVKTGGIAYIGIVIAALSIFILLLIFNKNMKNGTKRVQLVLSVSILGMMCYIAIGNSVQAQECWHASDSTYKIGDTTYYSKSETKGSGNTANNTYYTYGYYSHDYYIAGKTIPAGQLFCTDGKEMAFKYRNGTGSTWTYTHTSNVSHWYSVTQTKAYNKATMKFQSTTVSAKVVSSDYIIGPFKVKYNGTVGDYSLYGKNVKDGVVTINKPTICDSNGNTNGVSIGNNTNFYIKVPISSGMVKVSLLTINCSTKGIEWTKGKETYTQEWTTKSYKEVDGDAQKLHMPEETHDYNDFDKSDSSSWVYSSKKDYSDSDKKTMDISLTGEIIITKTDTDNTLTKLSGATFEITGPNNYSETKTTNANGTITISNLPLGNYTVTETGAPADYRLNLQENKSTTVNVTGGGTATAAFKNKQYGDLTVIKKDQDTGNTSIGGEVLKGIKFKLYVNKNGKKYYLKNTSPTKYSYSDFSVEESDISNAKTFTTDDNAQFSISNLPVYEGQSEIIYNVEEYELPDNLKEYYELKPSADIVKKLQNGKTVYLDVYNKQKYIQISGYVWDDKPADEGKEDSRNDLYDADRKEPLIPGITVRLKSTIREMVHPNGKGDINNDGKVDSTDLMQLLYYVSGRDESLSVDAINRGDINNDGRANIQDLILLLRILEDGDVTSLGYGKGDLNSDGVVDLSDINIELNHVSGSQIITGENVKHAADINGDGVVDTRDLMLLVKGVAPGVITVREEGTLQTTKTGNDGKYEFKKVKIDQLSSYYIEFEYNGLKYQSVAYHNQDNGSKAIEGDTTRDNFNNQYASITGGNAKGTTTTGYSRNATGTVMNNLTYTNGKYASELVGNTGYTVESAENSVEAQNGSTGASIKATTSAANHSLATWSAGVVKLENINLGIYKRQQSDMKIATDLKDIGLTFNGYNHTYTYNKRTVEQGIDIFSELQKWNKTDEQKTNENGQYPRNYETSIYKNYAYASAVDGNGKINDEYKLKMYLNYKIEIKNSSSVYMSANEIARYYNDTLTYSSSYYLDKNGNKHDITWNEKSDVLNATSPVNKYKQIRTTGLSNVKIEPGSSLTVYLTLQIKDDIIKEFGLGSRIDAIGQGVTEITSYSNYTGDGKYYAAIDKNSAPDNIKLGDVNTYEDDTDSAPELKITLKEPKTISGYVFEDKTSDGLLTNQERNGNGKFDDGENTVGKVKVELIDQTTGEAAYIYPEAVSKLNFNAKPAIVEETGTDGCYEFVGVIPGKYYIKYTYSNGSVVYKGTDEETNKETNKVANVSTQDYKSTIISSKTLRDAYGDTVEDDIGSVNNNDRWYQDTNIETYSTAVDDYATRKSINNTYSTIIASNKVDYDNGGGQQEMTARTLNMNMAIENYNNEVTNMNENRTSLYKNLDFGIVIRPRQSLKLDKKVTYVKLTLSGGDTVAEGNPSNENELKTMNYVTYPKGGKLKIEADDEIIQGATLEIKYTIYVTNNSEKDYNNVSYYRYGTKKDNPVKLSINTIVDYIDQKVPTEYTNVAKSSGGWYVSTDQQIKDLTTEKAYNDVKSRKNILLSDCNKTISIGETMATEPVEVSKVMASSEDVDIKNYAETVKVSNSVGRFYGGIVNSKWVNMTPGNLQVSSDTVINKYHELDDDGVEVVVVPSTGDNTIIYYILGITCLGIIVCGIVLIKKLVL